MILRLVTLAMVVGLMLAEARVSRRHTGRLRQQGAVEPPGDVYPVMAVLYPGAFLAMGTEGLWRAAPPPGPWYAYGVLILVASKALKYWAIRSLGDRWSFHVFVVPGIPLVTTGPYRYVAHPNYIAVVGELIGAAMMMRARVLGPVMIGLFGVVLWTRIRFENRVLSS